MLALTFWNSSHGHVQYWYDENFYEIFLWIDEPDLGTIGLVFHMPDGGILNILRHGIDEQNV